MKYYLTRATLGATNLEIDENEYEDYKESSKVLSSCLSLENSYEILISNYIDLENEQLAWATLGMVRNVSDDDFFNVTLSLDRRMVNFLATARLHIEHLQKRGGDCMRGQAVEEAKADIKSFCDAEADKPKYKFMWDLRNEVQHSSLATHWFSFSTSRANSFDDPTPEFEFSLNFGSLKSSSTTGFKPEELDTISSDDQIDLVSLTRVYMESLSTIQVKFREYVAESVNQARSKMEEAFCRYREVCEDSLIYLELWKVGDLDKDKIIEESAFSLFYDDQRVQLQDKNRELVNLRNSHVTGKQAE